MTLGYIHHSARFDRAPEQLAQSLVEQAGHDGVNVIGLTEVASVRRVKAARAALDEIGWALAHPPHAECGVAFDRDVFELVHVREVQVSKIKTWSKTGKLRKPFKVVFVLLREKATGLTYLITVGHTPSHVATRQHWYQNNRARQHRDGLKGWHKQMIRFGRDWKPTGGRVLSMDLNMDLRSRWVRLYVGRHFPSLRIVQDQRYAPTHGSRPIDVVMFSRRLNPLRWFKGKRVRVVKAKDSDHRSVIVRLARRLRRK